MLEDIHQMDGIGTNLGSVVVEGRRQHLEGKAGRSTVHAFVDAGRILVFLNAPCLRVALFQAFAS
jgi:hypothetical protein